MKSKRLKKRKVIREQPKQGLKPRSFRLLL